MGRPMPLKNQPSLAGVANDKNDLVGHGDDIVEDQVEEENDDTGSDDSPPDPDEKRELMEGDAYDKLGFGFPTWKKWMTLSVMFFVQVSLNLNPSIYANAVPAVSHKFHVSMQAARVPQLTYLAAYGFGGLLWAPWSEELGRWPTTQLSLLLVNIWQIPCALAPNYATLVVCRFLGGLSSAGASVTLGALADMWESDDQGYAVAFLVIASAGGPAVGAVIGGFVEKYLTLPWIFWVQLIIGGVAQIAHFVLVPETRATLLLNKEAEKRRKNEEEVYGPNELHGFKLSPKDIAEVLIRPFHMLFTEPIVLWLSAVSGFSDALIFTFLEGFLYVYKQWGFDAVGVSLAFIPILLGTLLGYLSLLPSIRHFQQKRRKHGSDSVEPESRLWWLLFVIMLEPIGLFGFAWTSLGPQRGVHWIAPMIFSTLVGIGNYVIYESSIDYTVAAYGPYAASATGGNDFARNFLSAIAAIYAAPLYQNIRPEEYSLEYASTILACFAILVCSPVFYFYRNGPAIREKCKFAKQVLEERKRQKDHRAGSGARHSEESSASAGEP